MVMVDVDSSCQVWWLGRRVGGHLALSLHSSNEPGESLAMALSHDDSTINIIPGIITVIY